MAQLIDDIVLDASAGVHRPRNLDWKRAAALLYGDWGTSKAYVIGLAFLAAGFSSLPIILAVCAVTALVGINYIVICRHFPDGGGVYSSARSQGRLLAVVGALLLVADLTVTAALSGWSALSYVTSGAEHIIWIKFLRDHIALTTIGVLLVMGLINCLGPKHSGSFAVALALPTAVVVILLIALSAPHLTTRFLERPHQSFTTVWVQFVGVILALSGAESIANLTGVMKLDPGSTMETPRVARESLEAISSAQPARRPHVAVGHCRLSAHRRAAFCGKLHCACRPLCDRRGRGDHGEPWFLHIQSGRRFHLVRSRALWHHVRDSGFGRTDAGSHQSGCASICARDSNRWASLARLHAETAGPYHANGNARSRSDGHA